MDSQSSDAQVESQMKKEKPPSPHTSSVGIRSRPTSSSPTIDDLSTTENDEETSSSGSASDSDDSGSQTDSSSCSSKSAASEVSSTASKKSSRSPSASVDSCLARSRDLSDATCDNSNDGNESSSRPRRSRVSPDLKDLINNNPDMYGVRRSSRSRKEPERFTAADVEDSDSSDQDKRPHKRRSSGRKRSKWEDSFDESDFSDSDVSSHRHHNRTSRGRKSRGSNKRATSTRRRVTRHSSSDESLTEDEDTRTSRRTHKKISYKEQSDHTDSDDLLDVDYGESGKGDGVEEEDMETIEKVLKQRIGRVGATGVKTAFYNVEADGDPNEGLRDDEEKEQQFLIKWKNKSYLHATWESDNSLAEMKVRGLKKIENFIKREDELKDWRKYASPEDIEYADCQEEMMEQLSQLYLRVERIIAHQPSRSTETCHPEYLCKWEGLSYTDCTFEDGALIQKKFPQKVEEYYQRQKSQKTPSKLCKVLKIRPKFLPVKSQPEWISGQQEGFKLRDYQLDGLNWLTHSWCRENGVILADEMGLGKTIQTICFLSMLYNIHQLYGPFLLVVPLSTMTSWQREFAQWAPELNVVVYIGDVASRNMIREFEWNHLGNKRLKFNVLLTTYEILLKDKGFLGSTSWAVLAVDEAHRLKNDDSLLYKTLIEFDTNHRILITGTPLQNSLRELWALLHFIMPTRFQCWEDFEAEHADADKKGYAKLHKELEPYLLRRVKKDVEKSLPAKVEQILRVEMTSIQKQFYKWILTKNYRALAKGMKGSVSGFANIMMELKKCCNHASLIRPLDDLNQLEPLTRLLRGSGKLFLLDKLLCRLNETGHRVLIFSQMVRMLDILSDYLTLRRFPFQRLDGSIKGELRKQALDHFNAEGSQDFCFLLSTRAGGLGINLATADTVIIFDSDWNPQNDLQAQARAHRIGQKNQVNIYRLVTKGSVEEDIIERAKQKMVLDHLVIQRMDTTGKTILSKSQGTSASNSTPFNKEELAQILKFGAEELFKEGEDGDEEPHVDIDEILRRAETRDESSSATGNELLNSFKMASFNFNEEDVDAATSKQEAEGAGEKDWDQIIPEAERNRVEEEEREKAKEEMCLGPRSRKTAQQANEQDSGDEYDPSKKGEEASDDSDAENRPRRKGKKRVDGKKSGLKGFAENEIRRFIKSFKKFPCPMKRLEAIALDSELQDKAIDDLKKLAENLQTECERCVKEHLERLQEAINDDTEPASAPKRGDRGPSFKLCGVVVFPKNLLSCQQELEPLDLLLHNLSTEERKRWTIPFKVPKGVKDWDVEWTTEDDSKLLAGVFEYGFGSWEAIKMDPTYGLSEKILPNGDLKPQGKQLTARVEYLLKQVSRHLNNEKSLTEKVSPKKKSKSVKAKREKNGKPLDKDKKRKKGKKLKHKDEKKKKKKKSKRDMSGPAMHFTANAAPKIIVDDLPPQVFDKCKEKMRPVKKQLKEIGKMEKSQLESPHTSEVECLLKIGERICQCLEEFPSEEERKEWRNNYWTFVSNFTDFTPRKLYRKYKEVKNGPSSNQQTASSSRHSLTPAHHSSLQNRHLLDKPSSKFDGREHKIPMKRPHDNSLSTQKRQRHFEGGHGDGFFDGHRNWPPPNANRSGPPHPNMPPLHFTDGRRSGWGPPPGLPPPPGYPPHQMNPYVNFGPGTSFRGGPRDRDWNRGPIPSAPGHFRPKDGPIAGGPSSANHGPSNIPHR